MRRIKPARTKPPRPSAKPRPKTDRIVKKPLILVVDDYRDARDMFAEYLRYSGYRVAEASNGEEAVSKAIELLPDVVLMDLSLPVLDGWEATRRLKSDPRTAGVRILAVT